MQVIENALMEARDGIKYYRLIMRRLAHCKPHRSLNELCTTADVSFTTVWRWKGGSNPEIDTVLKIEAVLKDWESSHLTQNPHPATYPAHAGTPQG